MQGDGNHVTELMSRIELGKYQNAVADRDINQYWAEYMHQKTSFDSKFDEWICTQPEKLRQIHGEMDHFIEKVKTGMFFY